MRLTSIRARVTLLSALFAILLVGGITVTTYFLVASGLSDSAQDASDDSAASGQALVEAVEADALAEAEDLELTAAETDAYVADAVTIGAPDSITLGVARSAAYSLYVGQSDDPELSLAWSAGSGEGSGSADERDEAAETGEVVTSVHKDAPVITGMVVSADLGQRLTYVPLEIRGLETVVLEVEYSPSNEEAITRQHPWADGGRVADLARHRAADHRRHQPLDAPARR